MGWIWLYELKVKKYRHFFGYGDIYILEVKEKVVYYKSKFYFFGSTLEENKQKN